MLDFGFSKKTQRLSSFHEITSKDPAVICFFWRTAFTYHTWFLDLEKCGYIDMWFILICGYPKNQITSSDWFLGAVVTHLWEPLVIREKLWHQSWHLLLGIPHQNAVTLLATAAIEWSAHEHACLLQQYLQHLHTCIQTTLPIAHHTSIPDLQRSTQPHILICHRPDCSTPSSHWTFVDIVVQMPFTCPDIYHGFDKRSLTILQELHFVEHSSSILLALAFG